MYRQCEVFWPERSWSTMGHVLSLSGSVARCRSPCPWTWRPAGQRILLWQESWPTGHRYGLQLMLSRAREQRRLFVRELSAPIEIQRQYSLEPIYPVFSPLTLGRPVRKCVGWLPWGSISLPGIRVYALRTSRFPWRPRRKDFGDSTPLAGTGRVSQLTPASSRRLLLTGHAWRGRPRRVETGFRECSLR